MDERLNGIKVLLGLLVYDTDKNGAPITSNDTSKDEVLDILLKQATDTICIYLGTKYLPAELDFVAMQMVIVRYNKLGAEGIVNEKIDVLSTTYSYNVDELAPYKGILDNYKALHKDDKDENGEYIYDRHSNNKYNGRFKML